MFLFFDNSSLDVLIKGVLIKKSIVVHLKVQLVVNLIINLIYHIKVHRIINLKCSSKYFSK